MIVLRDFTQDGVFNHGFHGIYPLVICYKAMENPFEMEVLMGKSSVNGPFSIAMLNYQRVVDLTNREWWFNEISRGYHDNLMVGQMSFQMFLKKKMVLHWTLGKLVEVSRVTCADRVDISNWLSSFRSQQYDEIQLNPFHQHFKSHFESALPNRANGSKLHLAGGFKPFLFSISYMGCHPSHWRTPSFFKMAIAPPTSHCIPI